MVGRDGTEMYEAEMEKGRPLQEGGCPRVADAAPPSEPPDQTAVPPPRLQPEPQLSSHHLVGGRSPR